MSFSNSSILVLNDTGTTESYLTNQSSPLSINIPSGSTGTWTWVVSRAGYSSQLGTFDTTGGGVDSASPTPAVRLTPTGSNMYTASSDTNVTIVFDLSIGNEKCFIDIGDGSVSPQAIIDEIEVALETEDGCKFLASSGGSESSIAILAGQTYLLLGTQYRVRRETVGDANASVESFVISADGTPLDGVNGGVQFLTSSEGLTAQQIYDLFTTGTNADAFKANLPPNIELG